MKFCLLYLSDHPSVFKYDIIDIDALFNVLLDSLAWN